MQSSQSLSKRIAILAFDADGCLYSLNKYTRVLIEIVDKHWDFFVRFYGKNDLSSAELADRQAKVEEILADIKKTNFKDYGEYRYEIKSVKLKRQIVINQKDFKKKGFEMQEIQVLRNMLSKFVPFLKNLNPEIIERVFIGANQELFDHIAASMQAEQVVGFKPAFASNRQSMYHDSLSMETNGTESIHVDYYHLINYLRSKLPGVMSHLSALTLSDVYASILSKDKDFTRGEAHAKIVSQHAKTMDHKDHPPYIFDTSKLTIVYALSHDAVIHASKELNLKAGNYEYVLDFYDNEMPILESLKKALTVYPELLPREVNVRLYHYDGQLKREPFAEIKGTGPLDRNYPENIRKMASMCGHDFKTFDKEIHVASQLDIPAFLKERILDGENRKAAVKGLHLFDRAEDEPNNSKRAKLGSVTVFPQN